jgi:hypothetical protein
MQKRSYCRLQNDRANAAAVERSPQAAIYGGRVQKD